MKIENIIIIALSVLLFCGCTSTKIALVDHPRAVVRGPAKAGETAGDIIGIPVCIISLPITLIYAACTEDREAAKWAPLYPMAVSENVFTTVIGGVPWLVFGWWGSTEDDSEHQPGHHR